MGSLTCILCSQVGPQKKGAYSPTIPINGVHYHSLYFVIDLQQALKYLHVPNPGLGTLVGYSLKAKGFSGPMPDKI